ncbi:MAG: SDR family oxidoreductase [Aridibacter sp.]
MKNIFLTGATGYLGSVIAEKLKGRGYKVVGLVRNAVGLEKLADKNIELVEGSLEDLDILIKAANEADAVIHTAFTHNSGNYNENAQLDRDVVKTFGEALLRTNKPLIITSTSAILGDTGTVDADEDFPFDQNSSRAIRGETERDMQQMLQKGVRAIVLRMPLFIYGRSGSGFVPYMIEQSRKLGSANYIGDGEQLVSAIHVEDAAELYVAALETGTAKGVYNAATESVSLKKINQAIARLLNVMAKSISVEKGLEQFGGMYEFLSKNNQISADKAKRQIEWSPNSFTTIEDDIENGSYRKFAIKN